MVNLTKESADKISPYATESLPCGWRRNFRGVVLDGLISRKQSDIIYRPYILHVKAIFSSW